MREPIIINWLYAQVKNRQTQAIILSAQLLMMWFASSWHLMDWNERRYPYWVLLGGLLGHVIGLMISTSLLTELRTSPEMVGRVKIMPESKKSA